MTSIDELFKKSGLPSKRKLDPVRDPTEIYKSAKLSPNGHSARHQAHVDDDPDTEAGPSLPPDDGNDDDDGDYGPAPPPADGEEDDNGDDEEGRFFGGGISAQESEILDFVEGADASRASAAAPDTIDAAWLRRTALSLEKKITRNAEQRARFADEPARFIQSEADLDAEIKALSALTDHPELYAEFARLGCPGSLAGLLAHDNTDIAIDVLELVAELTDEDVAAEDAHWGLVVDALLDADLLSLLASNLARLNESAEDGEADRTGVYHALSVVENLCSRPATADMVGRDAALPRWLLDRAQKPERPVSQNKQYAAELLAILAQASPANRRRLAGLDAVDALLRLASAYRRRDPERGGDEEEYMENLFEALVCLVDEPDGKARFIDAEGIELCLIMLKEGKTSRDRALRLLDHAVSGSGSGSTDDGPSAAEVARRACVRLVEAGGLKTTFTAFMRRSDRPALERLVGIFSWMLRLLPFDSAERVRALAKFVERDYEKTAKLVRIRREYAARADAVRAQIDEERAEREQRRKKRAAQDDDDEDDAEMEDEWLSRRLDAGLYCLQTVDVVLAWLVAEDDGAARKIRALLADRDETLAVLGETIQEQIDGIDAESEEGRDTRDMLTTLKGFLR